MKITDLTPAEYNPRTITDGELKGLKKALETFGDLSGIVYNKLTKNLVGGHQRVSVFKEKNPEIFITEEYDEPQQDKTVAVGYFMFGNSRFSYREVEADIKWEKKANLTANNPYIQGKFETAKLADIIAEIKFDDDFSDLNLDGFEIPNLEEKIEEEVKDDSFDTTPPEKSKTKLGDLYELNGHRLYCGDSTDHGAVDWLMDGKLASMIFTDPPYNADYSSRVDKGRRKEWGGIMNDKMTADAFTDFLYDVNGNLHVFLEDGGCVYECIDWKRYPQLANVFSDFFQQKSMIVWNKNYFGLGTYYRTKHEIILFGVKGDKLKTWTAGHNEMDVWTEDREIVSKYVHPTQKPVTIPGRAIKNSSNKEDIVLDLFLGSGSTLIACEQLERKCYGMELDPKYCDVIVKRYIAFMQNAKKEFQIKLNGSNINEDYFNS